MSARGPACLDPHPHYQTASYSAEPWAVVASRTGDIIISIAILRAEASRFNPTKSSKLLGDLGNSDVTKRLALSGEQVELARRLIELTRDIIRAWLLRDLEAVPPPPVTVLAERLSDRGVRLRARLVAHAESLALEGILDREQARPWRLGTHQRAGPLLPGRLPLWPPPVVTGNEPAAELAEELRALARRNQQAGFVFSLLLGTATWSPRMELPNEQRAMVRRVNNLAAAIKAAWLKRGLDQEPMPKWSVLADRYVSSARVLDSMDAHAEAIVLDGVLTPEQSDRLLAIIWRLRGLNALLDPQFATRLRLSAAQREELQDLLYNRMMLQNEFGARDRISEQEATIWSVLNVCQARELERMLGQRTQSPPSAKAKKSSPPG